MGFFDKIREGLQKTRDKVARSIESVFNRRDPGFYQELEEILISADVGPVVSKEIVEELKAWEKTNPGATADESLAHLESSLTAIFTPASPWEESSPSKSPMVVLLVGVNGVGKTTTAGKLAARFRDAGNSVILGAADTFRAAAIEQLRKWGERLDIPVVHQKPGADPASVAFDTVRAARARGIDMAIIDTAGRLQNKQNLMNELRKIGAIIHREAPDSPVEVLLVLDATIGQNALSQLDEFVKIAPVSGLVLTKLDGTSRGGVVIALARRHKIPVRFIGVGEKTDDLLPFDPSTFVRSILRTS
ncbi:MAG: signal recognition particle-docking protein FtsY [Nitrospirae bacterium]|uniref:Signal recognition particle receptor FtsY n=1 Tax=Leptospirillum ferrodiazotrophum TaxID=412449 RepID=C6HXI7_9BACT|nr:MAG: Cell division protein (FtsY) [Leptospirillum ferrodiazotrophum]MCL5953521.1 signal recognition particle-docking protein FtsY [Nitrospirota bacterium]